MKQSCGDDSLTDKNKLPEELTRQRKLLEVINETSEILLSSESDDLEKSLIKAMEHMARCVNVDRMFIWRNKNYDGKLSYERQYAWIEEDKQDFHRSPNKTYFYIETIPQWDDLFSSGKHINGPLSSLSKTEQEILSPFGIRSILVIPLFLQKNFWGFVSFDDLKSERTFFDDEVSTLRIACLLLANAIVRNHDNNEMEERIEQQKLVASISRSFISKEPIKDLIIKALEATGKFLKTNKILIITQDEETGLNCIEYCWYSSEEWKPVQTGAGFNKSVRELFPETVPETGFVTAICCNHITNEFGGKFNFFEKVGAKSIILAPVYSDGIYWGHLCVEECSRYRTWKESDVQLVGTVTSSIAIAISRELIDKARADALQQAVNASTAKGNFLANMSHEIRTPMNAIIGMTSIGKHSKDIAKKDYAFEKIENASTHLLGVINDILDISKIEANKFELSPVSFNFGKMLEKVASVTDFRIAERNQKFTIHIDHKIPNYIIGDDQYISQIITNLLSNAVKFTPEHGTIELDASLVEKVDDLYTIQVGIKDSGIGISKEQKERIFNSFEQADSGTSRKYGGTGLGLAISKRIVELMGGQIWIESELGHGSTFAFTIKVKKGHGADKRMLAPGVNIRNMRILSVDDNQDILEYFNNIMARLEINCDIASSGEEALQKIKTNGNYHIYFVDLRMPGMNGIELTRRIKKQSDGKSVVIMISAFEWNNIEEDAKKAGVDKFLSKPLFPSSIVDTINECLGSSSIKEALEDTDSHMIDSLGDFTILLAEDVDINREIVLTLLEPTALNIDIAENGIEAYEKFAANPKKYSMIFMDVQMPEMDGYTATRKIRSIENEWARKIPIVAMTANVFREDVEKCIAAGMNDHVGKPLDPKDMMIRLKKYLHKK